MPEVSVAVLAGDGIGPEVVAEARRVVNAIAPDHGLVVDWHDHLVGGISIDAEGTALTDEVLEACRASDAVLLGAVGGPRVGHHRPRPAAPRAGAAGPALGPRPLRQPAPRAPVAGALRRQPPAAGAHRGHRSPGGARAHRRPLLRRPRPGGDRAFDTCVYTLGEVARLAEWGFRAAGGRRRKVTSVDKANVLETSRLWREQVIATAARSSRSRAGAHAGGQRAPCSC